MTCNCAQCSGTLYDDRYDRDDNRDTLYDYEDEGPDTLEERDDGREEEDYDDE